MGGGGRGRAGVKSRVLQMRADGLSEQEIRAHLRADGYQASRVSQLLKQTRPSAFAAPLAAPAPSGRMDLDASDGQGNEPSGSSSLPRGSAADEAPAASAEVPEAAASERAEAERPAEIVGEARPPAHFSFAAQIVGDDFRPRGAMVERRRASPGAAASAQTAATPGGGGSEAPPRRRWRAGVLSDPRDRAREAGPRMGESVLVLKAEYLELILAGRKTLEIRDRRLASKTYWLATEGAVLGSADLRLEEHIANVARWQALMAEHHWNIDFLPYKKTYAFRIENVRRLEDPVLYFHPHGAVGLCRFRPVYG